MERYPERLLLHEMENKVRLSERITGWQKPTAIDFYALEEPWTKLTDSYSSEPEGDCISTVKRIFAEVFEQ